MHFFVPTCIFSFRLSNTMFIWLVVRCGGFLVLVFLCLAEPAVEMSQRSLKPSRKVAKALVTKKMNKITSLMCAVENVNVVHVIAIESELEEAMENFYHAHDDYYRSLMKVEAQDESVSYERDILILRRELISFVSDV